MTIDNELYLARLSGNLSYPNVFSQLVARKPVYPPYLLYTAAQQFYQPVYLHGQQCIPTLDKPTIMCYDVIF